VQEGFGFSWNSTVFNWPFKSESVTLVYNFLDVLDQQEIFRDPEHWFSCIFLNYYKYEIVLLKSLVNCQ
jgi:hypothetical protein